jgi:membrane protein DedA with SNARE-associated domain
MESPAEFLARWHYGGLFAVILAEEAGVPLPIPGDAFIAAMGFLAHRGAASFVPTAAVVTSATVVGATALYLVSRHAGRPLLVKVARRFGFTEARERRLEGSLQRHGAAAVVLLRLVPGLRIVMTVVAGVLRLPHPTFVIGTFFAGIVWSTLYFWLGWLLGAGYERLAGRVPAEVAWGLGAAALLAAAALLLWWRGRRTRGEGTQDGPPAT